MAELQDIYEQKRMMALMYLSELKAHIETLPISTNNYKFIAAVQHYAALLKELADHAKKRNEYAEEVVNTSNLSGK